MACLCASHHIDRDAKRLPHGCSAAVGPRHFAGAPHASVAASRCQRMYQHVRPSSATFRLLVLPSVRVRARVAEVVADREGTVTVVGAVLPYGPSSASTAQEFWDGARPGLTKSRMVSLAKARPRRLRRPLAQPMRPRHGGAAATAEDGGGCHRSTLRNVMAHTHGRLAYGARLPLIESHNVAHAS